MIEEIRRAEKDVMEVQERLLRTGDKRSADQIELNPWNVEKYSLLCPRMFVNNANEEKEGEYIIAECVLRAYSSSRDII